jgi:hypothetical protein
MKRFHFPLERVRQWRNLQAELEHAKLQQLYEKRRRLELAAAQLASVEAEAGQAVQRAFSARQALDGQQLTNLDEYRLCVRRQERLLAGEREELEERIAGQRARLVDARRKFRLLDMLKQRTLSEWERDYGRELENLASELHLAKWRRSQPEPRDRPAR